MQTFTYHFELSKNMKRPHRSCEKGFTLLELIVVIIIIALLASMVAPKFIGYADQARQTDAQAQIENLGQALDLYRLEKGKYPTTEEGLDAIKSYLKKELPQDPWGNPYHYESPGQHGDYDLMSYGADNAEGGEENDTDIVSWRGIERKSDS